MALVATKKKSKDVGTDGGEYGGHLKKPREKKDKGPKKEKATKAKGSKVRKPNPN